MIDFTLTDIEWMKNKFLSSYDSSSLDEYIRKEKIERMKNVPTSLFDYSDMLFSEYETMSPQDMEFDIVVMSNTTQLNEYFSFLEVTTSHLIQRSIPGRSLCILVKECNTRKIVGFIRLGSPIINMKPRNDLFGVSNYATNPGLKVFNHGAYMGFIIVPVQPFGYNYIGGKLLTLICISHEVQSILREKYDMFPVLFETTSLYGSLKAASQYDGMKPFIRKGGQTESQFIPPLRDDLFRELVDKLKSHKIESKALNEGVSSRKLKVQNLIISIIKNWYDERNMSFNKNEFENDLETIQNTLTTQKNYYYSTLGYENAIQHMLTGEELRRASNYDMYSMENLVEWWRKKAINRYENLRTDGRLRTRLEVWTDEDMQRNVDIVR